MSTRSMDSPTLRALGVICERHTAARTGEPTDPPTWFGRATLRGAHLFISIDITDRRKPHARWVIQADVVGVRRELREGGEPVGTSQKLVYAQGATFEEAHAEAVRQAGIVANGAEALAQLVRNG